MKSMSLGFSDELFEEQIMLSHSFKSPQPLSQRLPSSRPQASFVKGKCPPLRLYPAQTTIVAIYSAPPVHQALFWAIRPYSFK